MEFIYGLIENFESIINFLHSFIPPISLPQTPWPTEVYQSCFNPCRRSMIQKGMTDKQSNMVCYCMGSSFGLEFGVN